METFYQYDINLEDNNYLDFRDLLNEVLVLVQHRKFLAGFIYDKEIDLVYKYTESQKVSTPPNIIKPSLNPNPPNQFQPVERAV